MARRKQPKVGDICRVLTKGVGRTEHYYPVDSLVVVTEIDNDDNDRVVEFLWPDDKFPKTDGDYEYEDMSMPVCQYISPSDLEVVRRGDDE